MTKLNIARSKWHPFTIVVHEVPKQTVATVVMLALAAIALIWKSESDYQTFRPQATTFLICGIILLIVALLLILRLRWLMVMAAILAALGMVAMMI